MLSMKTYIQTMLNDLGVKHALTVEAFEKAEIPMPKAFIYSTDEAVIFDTEKIGEWTDEETDITYQREKLAERSLSIKVALAHHDETKLEALYINIIKTIADRKDTDGNAIQVDIKKVQWETNAPRPENTRSRMVINFIFDGIVTRDHEMTDFTLEEGEHDFVDEEN